MKRFITPAATFNPAAGTLDLSAIAAFDIRRLAAVFDLKTPAMIYGPVAGFGATAVANGVLTLQATLAGLGASDSLLVIYDDATGKVAEDASVQSVVSALQTLIGDLANNHADLQGIHTDLSATLHGDLQAIVAKLGSSPAQSGDVAAVVTKLGNPAQTGDVAAVVARLGAAPAQTGDISALGVVLQSILTTIQAQRTESLWTDDSGAFYVRVETPGNTNPTWLTYAGVASAAPGTGARPAAGTTLLTTTDTFRALNTAAGQSPAYNQGDLLKHVTTQDPKSGAIVGQFWINATQATTPAVGSITATDLQLLDPQAEGAATLAGQQAALATLTTIANGIAQLHTDAQTNHGDLVTLHTDGGTTLHTDLQALATLFGVLGNPAAGTVLALLTGIKAALSGTLATKPAAPTPSASAGYVTALAAKAGPCTSVDVQASNASLTVEGYLVVVDLAAVPAVNAAITPLKFRRLPTNDGAGGDGTAEIDTPFSVANGLVVLLTTSLTTFVPGALSGVINASYLS